MYIVAKFYFHEEEKVHRTAIELVAMHMAHEITVKNQLCILIYQTANKVSRLYGALLSSHGLTFPQYQVLIALWESGPSTVGALCAALSLDTSTITPVVKRLQSMGYVDRFRDRIDERKVYVSLTDKGAAFKEEAKSLRCKLVGELAMTPEEFLELQRLLRGLSRTMDRLLSPAGSGTPPRRQFTSTP